MEQAEACKSGYIRRDGSALKRRRTVSHLTISQVYLFTYYPARLLDYKTQERFYEKIVERYKVFCSSAVRGDELHRRLAQLDLSKENENEVIPKASDLPNSKADVSNELDAITMGMRKLREGIVASKRVDDFSIQAYIFCIRLSILLKHWESYHPAMRHLLQVMHPVHPLSNTELQEFAGYQVLDFACRQRDLARAFSVKLQLGLRDTTVDSLLRAIAHDNYFLFWRIKRGVDGHKAKIMEFAEDEMKLHALKSIGKTYLTIDLASLEQLTDTPWASLAKNYGVGWQLEGTKVVIRKPKAR
jgi:hypothetical protein